MVSAGKRDRRIRARPSSWPITGVGDGSSDRGGDGRWSTSGRGRRVFGRGTARRDRRRDTEKAHQTTQPQRRLSVGGPMHRVVITGIGIVAPNGIGRREFCEAIFEGRSGVDYIRSFDTSGLSIKIAGEVRDFDVSPYLGEHKKNLKLMSRAVRFAMGASAMAVEDAGLDTSELDPSRFVVCMGTGISTVVVGELRRSSIRRAPPA